MQIPTGRGNFWGNGDHCKAVSCAKTAEPIDLLFGLRTRVGRRKHMFNRTRQVSPMCPHGKALCTVSEVIDSIYESV